LDNETRQWVVLGRIGKTHVLKGWVRLHSFTEPEENLLEYTRFRAGSDTDYLELEIDEVGRSGDALIAHFTGYDDPDAVRTLTGRQLQIAGEELPDLAPGEYYWHQLEGLRVINRQGQVLGLVTRILETGANDVLVVAPSADSIDDRERLIPYLRDRVIRMVSVDDAVIEVDWEADYLA
jgi:16S rRNA processing protein RimM